MCSDIPAWFEFVFPWWLVMLDIFSWSYLYIFFTDMSLHVWIWKIQIIIFFFHEFFLCVLHHCILSFFFFSVLISFFSSSGSSRIIMLESLVLFQTFLRLCFFSLNHLFPSVVHIRWFLLLYLLVSWFFNFHIHSVIESLQGTFYFCYFIFHFHNFPFGSFFIATNSLPRISLFQECLLSPNGAWL